MSSLWHRGVSGGRFHFVFRPETTGIAAQHAYPFDIVDLSVALSLAPSHMQHEMGALTQRVAGLAALDPQGDTSYRRRTYHIQ